MYVQAFIYFVNSKYFLLHTELTSERKVYDFDYCVTIQELKCTICGNTFLCRPDCNNAYIDNLTFIGPCVVRIF